MEHGAFPHLACPKKNHRAPACNFHILDICKDMLLGIFLADFVDFGDLKGTTLDICGSRMDTTLDILEGWFQLFLAVGKSAIEYLREWHWELS